MNKVGIVFVLGTLVASACSDEFSSDCFETRTCRPAPSDAGAAGDEGSDTGGTGAGGGEDAGLGGAAPAVPRRQEKPATSVRVAHLLELGARAQTMLRYVETGI